MKDQYSAQGGLSTDVLLRLFENVVQRLEVNTRNSSCYPLLNNQLAQARSICGQFTQHSFDSELLHFQL